MRKLYIYQVIRYYPNIRGDEFFNIGIKLIDSEKKTKIKFIQKDHLSYVHRFPSIEKRVIDSMVEHLKDAEKSSKAWYGNYVKIGQEKMHRSDESFDKVFDSLYEDFIGYKFHKKEKIDTLERIKKQTKILIEKEFKGHLRVEPSSIFDFVVYDKKDIEHLSDLGSITNKFHVNKMIWQREESFLKSNLNNNMCFDFLNISKDTASVAENLLMKNEVQIVPYTNDENRYEYFKSMIA